MAPIKADTMITEDITPCGNHWHQPDPHAEHYINVSRAIVIGPFTILEHWPEYVTLHRPCPDTPGKTEYIEFRDADARDLMRGLYRAKQATERTKRPMPREYLPTATSLDEYSACTDVWRLDPYTDIRAHFSRHETWL